MNAENPMASSFQPMVDYTAKHFRFATSGEAERRIAALDWRLQRAQGGSYFPGFSHGVYYQYLDLPVYPIH